jgi:transposase
MGETPVLRHSYRRDRLSVISTITVSPRHRRLALYARFHRRNITGEEVAEFLGHLLRHVRGPIELVWDGGPIHRRRSVGVFLRRHYPRLQVHRFPAYAPELNPDEYVWTRSKQRLANTTPHTIDQLQHGVRRTIKRIRHSQVLLWSCIHEADLPWK